MNPAFLSNNDNFYPFTIPQNLNKRNIYPLIEYLLMDGQKDIGEQGFIPIRPWKLR